MRKMNIIHRFNLIVLGVIVLAEFSKCTEFVPVYIWGTSRTIEHQPALHKVSQNSFKDDILDRLKSNPILVVFTEQTLSPEDFSQRDESGFTTYPRLLKLRKTYKASYFPYVQNPIKALDNLVGNPTLISADQITEGWNVPDSQIIIIELNDASENEQRHEMLKRHDSLIASVYEKVLNKYGNVLAIYTAHRTSWVGSEEIVQSRRTRSLLASDLNSTTNQFFGNDIFFYTSGSAILNGADKVNLTYTESNESSVLTLTGSGISENGAKVDLKLNFTRTASNYWNLHVVVVTIDSVTFHEKVNGTIYAPLAFSYACGNQVFKNASLGQSITLPRFQVQPLYRQTILTQQMKFDDPYHCVGFTSIPIWSGLFVTFILMLIMTFGLTMMMDIKTMDRFDDAKGKTITISAAE
ncbi:V-type proton ATPase subunit S1 [Cylas formicarius]|uniref:V-type proton ATPase subunit S1 n=1 Tax=Cylas formicarius TaxID=197179 RepID=UPI002958DD5D|nr:V-type proton ATPase subunit S1 [Cylas formicarius]